MQLFLFLFIIFYYFFSFTYEMYVVLTGQCANKLCFEIVVLVTGRAFSL